MNYSAMSFTGHETGHEIMAQQDSTGILYQGYDKDFHLCIYEEGGVQGRNERYEFRCDTSLECCGRVCCVPIAAGIPLWLWLLFLILGLLLLLALLSLLWYLCARRKRKAKKEIHGGYRTIRQADDDQRGYRFGDGNEYAEAKNLDKRLAVAPRRGSLHESEHFEEKFVPSPLQETLLEKPQPMRVVEHDDALSRGSLAPEPVDITAPEPLRAQHAVYRPFIPDQLEESDWPPADRARASTHDLSEITTPKRPTVSTLEVPEQQQAEFMFTRPSADNVPSY